MSLFHFSWYNSRTGKHNYGKGTEDMSEKPIWAEVRAVEEIKTDKDATKTIDIDAWTEKGKESKVIAHVTKTKLGGIEVVYLDEQAKHDITAQVFIKAAKARLNKA